MANNKAATSHASASPSPAMAAGRRQGRRIPRQRLEQPMKRMKFEAIGADSTIYRRSSTSRLYSHCVVIHLNGQGPSKIWPEGVKPYSRTEWSSRLGLATPRAGARIGAWLQSRSWRRCKYDPLAALLGVGAFWLRGIDFPSRARADHREGCFACEAQPLLSRPWSNACHRRRRYSVAPGTLSFPHFAQR